MTSLTYELIPTVIAEYDRVVRSNSSPEWDTVAEVAVDDSGIYGVWGEVLDAANNLGYSVDDDGVERALLAATKGYQAALAVEVEERLSAPT